MSIVVHSRRSKMRAPGALYIDVTSKSDDATFVKLSPFFPHGGIRVPGCEAVPLSASVEGAWQGMKTFEKEGVDLSKLGVVNMKNLKRPANQRRGRLVGHAYRDQTIGYVQARKQIYVPMFEQVLNEQAANEVALLVGLVEEGHRVVLLDYQTNADVEDTSTPLSHACLIAAHVRRKCLDAAT